MPRPDESFLPVCGQPPSRCVFTWLRQSSGAPSSPCKSTNPTMRPTPSEPIQTKITPKGPISKLPSHWGLGLLHVSLQATVQATAGTLVTLPICNADIALISWMLYVPTCTLAVPTLPLFQVLCTCPRIPDMALAFPMNT